MPKLTQQMHAQISAILEERIVTEVYPVHLRFPTEKQLQDEFGVSRGTIRKALQALEARGMLHRTAGRGTFINPDYDQPPPSDELNLVGVLLPFRADQLSQDILHGAERVLRANNFSMIYANLENRFDLEETQISRMGSQRVAGMILFPLAHPAEPELVRKVAKTIPVVIVDREVPGFNGSLVMADHYGGAYAAVQYLIKLGHRRIGFVTHVTTSSSVADRLRGYQDAMRDASLLPFSPMTIYTENNHPLETLPTFSVQEAREFDHMLKVQDKFTAVFCVNDHLAYGMTRYATDRGVRVPDDLSIMGFDNSRLGQLAQIPLTTMAQSGDEIGMKAAELLVAQIMNGGEEVRRIQLPVNIVERGSTKALI